MPEAIAALDAFPLREPVSGRRYTVIRLRTGSGAAGYGECRAATARQLDQARRALAGKPATAYELVRRELAASSLRAAVDMALLDIAGKLATAPAYQLLGGPTRFKIRAMARLEGATGAELRASLDRARQSGFRAVIVPTPAAAARNQGQAFVRATRERLDQLRAAAGDGIDFVLDAAASLSPGDAATIAAELERFHLLWFDEPCRLSNLAAVRKIAGERVTPLGFGREMHEPGAFQDLLREQGIDVLRPDLARHGITGIRRLAALAETYYTAVAPYHEGGPVATAAALHLAAALPNFFIQQIPLPPAEPDRRMRAELAGRALETVKDGFAPLPEGSGLGIAVSDAALAEYREALP